MIWPWRSYLSDQERSSSASHDGRSSSRSIRRVVRVQRMTRKWGSCSSAGTITLAADLLDESDSFQDFVIAHELLHLRVPNHGRLFKALMTAHVPDWRSHEISRLNRPAL